jgi:type VI secretion system protein VasJ
MSLVMNIPADEVSRLLAAVDPRLSAGFFDIEDETYQAIDQEMVKLGGLYEASIDWPFIEEASRQYLGRQCKHFRIVGHLGVAWLRSGCWERWTSTLELLAGMVEHYWETAYPKPGPTGYLGKRKLVSLLLKRLTQALPQLDRFGYSAPRVASAQQALACLLQQAACAQLDVAALTELKRLLLKQATLAIGETDKPVPQTATAPASTAKLSEAFLPTPATVSLGNERETRRAVLAMAEFINQQDIYDPAGYQLRRFGLWAHIHSPPSTSRDHRTELMAVPMDIALGYEEAISSAAIDPALLLRVEKSVTAAPFWIRGSFLAATIAARLDMDEVAEAIRAATARFVRRLPALQQLAFSDGRVFMDEQSLAWLKGAEAQVTRGAFFQEFRPLQEELVAQVATEGVEAVLLQLQTLQADCHSPRERCHTTLIAADLLAARGVAWLAQDLCAGVARTMQAMTAQAWEPEIYQKLQQYGASSASIEQHKELAPR